MTITWDTFRSGLLATSDPCLPPGGCQAPRQLRQWNAFLDLFRVEAVDAWVRGPGGFPPWLAAMVRNFHPDAIRLGQVVLRGYLRDLRTRADPEGLAGFWDAAVAAVPGAAPALAGLFRGQGDRLRETLLAPEERPIGAQEQAFTDFLARCRDRLWAAGARSTAHALGWAEAVLDGLIEGRTRPPRRRPRRAAARVVFAWDHPEPGGPAGRDSLAPGIVVRFDLDPVPAQKAEVMEDTDPFDHTFLETVEQVQERFAARFYPLSHSCSRFGPKSLKGSSGGMAIGVAEQLAGRRLTLGAAGEALPPWVVITASLDRATGRALPVNSFAQKVEVLRRAGVRVVPTADDQPVEDALAGRMAREGLHLLRVGGTIAEVAGQLRRRPRLIDLWPAGEQAGLVNRRRAIGMALSGVAAAALGVWGWDALKPQTVATRAHDLDLMREHARAYKADSSRYLRERQQAGDEHGPDLQERDITLTGLVVLLKSSFFDMVDWVDCTGATNEDLAARPIEPTYLTRVLRLVKPEGYSGPGRITIRMDTAGHRVVPILDPAASPDEVSWRFNTMKEAQKVGGKVRSTYVTTDISRQPVGVPFDLVHRAIYWNGSQDQTVRQASSDWWGTRLPQGTAEADLAVHFPRKPLKLFGYHKARYKKLPNGERVKVEGAWDDLDPAEWDPRRTCPPGAVHRLAILTPVGPFDAPETIFAFQFSWA